MRKKLTGLAVVTALVLGLTAVGTNRAQAHRNGAVAGAVIGALVGGLIVGEMLRHKHRKHYRHRGSYGHSYYRPHRHYYHHRPYRRHYYNW